MKLILKLLLGIIVGILMGLFAPTELIRLLVTVKGVFGQFLSFIIPLIILFYVTSGIGNMRQDSGHMLGVVLVLAYLSTLAASFLAYLTAANIIPEVIAPVIASNTSKVVKILPLGTLALTPAMKIETALVLAFIFGIGISATCGDSDQSSVLQKAVDQGKQIIKLLLIYVVIPLLPVYICCVFAEMGATGTVFRTLHTFVWILAMAICLHWLWLLLIFCIAGGLTGRNPFRLLRIMLPSYVAALGTLSSAATIPVTVDCAHRLRVNRHVVNFSIPLCATIHISGSAITLTTCTIAVYWLTFGSLPTSAQFTPFLLALGVTLVAAPGTPGGGVMAALGLLSSMMGFGDSALAMMIALYLAQDGFGTACNVTGDGAIAILTDTVAQYRGTDQREEAD